ncbi:hypothetical protein XENOCAPTIV_000458 [Xenoophorus captivus]|uniref:Uncharacterized protein n=1 Tax=Xenoophorus captivus TaxID=1517983 RepID=A0ABV0Q465_9TELE
MTTSTKKTPAKRKHARTTYWIGGIEVCRNTFQFHMDSCRSHLSCSPFMEMFKAVSGTPSGRHHLNFKGLTEHIASIKCKGPFDKKVSSKLIIYIESSLQATSTASRASSQRGCYRE